MMPVDPQGRGVYRADSAVATDNSPPCRVRAIVADAIVGSLVVPVHSANPPSSGATPLAVAVLGALRVAGTAATREALRDGHVVPAYVDGNRVFIAREGIAVVVRRQT